MNQPVSRWGCLGGCLALLCLAIVPAFLFLLAMRGELTWRRAEFVEDRLWLITDQTASGDERGLGYSSSRIVSDETATAGPVCVRTQIYFLLWRGQGEHLDLCDCYTRAAGGFYEASGSCP